MLSVFHSVMKQVCLSILNTWHGRPEEKWNPQNSSFLQVTTILFFLSAVSDVSYSTRRAVTLFHIFLTCSCWVLFDFISQNIRSIYKKF